MIKDYVDNALTYLPDGTYFTLHYLHRKGFEHQLEDQGFDDTFYEGLLLNDTRISKSTLCKANVFVHGTIFSRNKAIVQMTINALEERDSEYLFEIANDIEEEYGIGLYSELKKEHKPLRYNKYTEKIYRNDDVFLEEARSIR